MTNYSLLEINIHYCLENRLPLQLLVKEEDFTENLADYCTKRGHNIRHLTFSDQYGELEMYPVLRCYPYVCFEDGVEWNVPYNEVSIADYIRTFPEIQKNGLTVYANNVAGASDFLECVQQSWIVWMDTLSSVLQAVDGIETLFSRILFGYGIYIKLKSSFRKQKHNKPPINVLQQFILQKKEWDIRDLAKQVDADMELLSEVLRFAGYISDNGIDFRFDQDTANTIETARREHDKQLQETYSTDVNCYSMNWEIKQLNGELLYYSVLLKEESETEESIVSHLESLLAPFKEYQEFLHWNEVFGRLEIIDPLPEKFDAQAEQEIRETAEAIRVHVRELCDKIE